MDAKRKVEIIGSVLCRSRKFETGQGTCSLLCMDQLGDPRKLGCRHIATVHGKLATQIIEALEKEGQ